MPQVGAVQIEHYQVNNEGINATDSPFIQAPGQAGARSRNYEYTKTGAFKKRFGHTRVNSVADTQLQSWGLGAHITKADIKTLIRAAERKLQAVNTATSVFTDLTEDTVTATSDFLAANTTQPINSSMFATPDADVLWHAGGGMDGLYGAYSTTKVTKNGVEAPTGSVTPSVGGSGGSFAATGTYFYALVYRKASTQALSNAALDVSATIAATTDEVTIPFGSLTNNDTTRNDKILVYRSAVGGTSAFTTGDLIATVDATDASYVDLGTSVLTAQNVPRAGNTILDNSPLPAGTPRYITMFKRRLVTILDNSIYISDLGKPESWPAHNIIGLPSGGAETGLGVISFTSPGAGTIDETLCLFKEDEFRVVVGTGALTAGIPDWSLLFIDSEGCDSHNSIVNGNGFLAWANRRGIFMWDGTGKPIYTSRLIEDFFSAAGDITKGNFQQVWGQLYKKQNQIIWNFSHGTFGTLRYQLKMDLRLSLPRFSSDFEGRVVEAVFTADTIPASMYAGTVFTPAGSAEETLFMADDAGFVYTGFTGQNDFASGIEFEYETTFLDQNQPDICKNYNQVLVWVDELGDWDLTLEYWSKYRTAENTKSSAALPISTSGLLGSTALWDVAEWDVAAWDDATLKPVRLIFNLRPGEFNNTQGEAIKLRFKQTGVDEPVTILKYALVYTPEGVIS